MTISETPGVGPSDLSLTNSAGNSGACSNLRTPSYVMRMPYWGANITILLVRHKCLACLED